MFIIAWYIKLQNNHTNGLRVKQEYNIELCQNHQYGTLVNIIAYIVTIDFFCLMIHFKNYLQVQLFFYKTYRIYVCI